MKILQNKFIINHKNNKNYSNKCISSMIFYMTTNTTTSAIVTAAIMIFMHAIVSVNTTETGGHIRPDTEITKTTTTTRTETETWTKTLFDLSKNPVIAQQSPKISTKTQTLPTTSTSSSTGAATTTPVFSKLNSFHMSHTAAATATMAQPNARNAKTSATSSSFTSTTSMGDCKSLTGAWGDVDPNIFYICDTQTKKHLQLRCPEGKGFFLGLGYSGCIPFDQWPACISSGHLEQVAVCDSEHMQQPWECMNPNKFFVCLKETIEPTILNCESGKGFVHAIVTTTTSTGSGGGSGTREGGVAGGAGTTSEIVGCANWEKWRNYMHCNDYY